MTVNRNLTSTALGDIERSLSQRDRLIIQTADKLGLVTGEQLRQLHFADSVSIASSRRTAQHTLRRMTATEVLHRLDRRIGGVRSGSAGFVYALGRAGQRLVRHWREAPNQRSRRTTEPGGPFVMHRVACAQLYVDLRVAESVGKLQLDAYLGEPDCWRKRVGPFGQPLTLKPDAYIEASVGDRRLYWFAEVDLGTETMTVIARKGRAYLDHYRSGAEREVMPRVIWLAPSDKRREQIVTTLHGLGEPSDQLHVVSLSEQAIQTMKGDLR